MMEKKGIASLKERFNDLDTVEKALVVAFCILLAFIVVSYMQSFIGVGASGVSVTGGATATGGRGGGFGGIGILGRGLG
jgi:hypothetical protein